MESDIDVTALRWRETLKAKAVVQMLKVEAFERANIVQLGKVLVTC